MQVTVTIDNTYADGHASSTSVELDGPVNGDDVEEWFDEVVWPHTGDGHGADVYDRTGARIGSCYTATITGADRPELIGRSYEWTD